MGYRPRIDEETEELLADLKKEAEEIRDIAQGDELTKLENQNGRVTHGSLIKYALESVKEEGF